MMLLIKMKDRGVKEMKSLLEFITVKNDSDLIVFAVLLPRSTKFRMI